MKLLKITGKEGERKQTWRRKVRKREERKGIEDNKKEKDEKVIEEYRERGRLIRQQT